MIKTILDLEDLPALIELGRTFHKESQFNDQPFNEEGCTSLLKASQIYQDKVFVAYDSDMKGVIILQMGVQFFSGYKWAGDQVLYVAPGHRGSTLAKELLEAGEQWARKHGASELVIFHNAGIKVNRAEKFYNAVGFDLSGLIFKKSFLTTES